MSFQVYKHVAEVIVTTFDLAYFKNKSMSFISKIQVIKADITKLQVDAIVNAANSSLLGGGGVDGAIHRAGGPAILNECKMIVARQGRCKTGEAVITTAGKMPAKYVIHTVGPVWHGGTSGEAEKLADCYRNSLLLAVQHNCSSIAFPAISTGVYGFPKAEAAHIAVTTINHFLAQHDAIKEVMLVCFDEESCRIISREFN
jgi:O-acetyl-ADP-ribose deacetylase (regulator of RNase III)